MTPFAAASPIPLYFLFGEPKRSVSPRFLHLESLEERSRPRNWQIRPHAHADLHHIFIVIEGGGRMDADGHALALRAPCLVWVPAGVVHGFAFDPGIDGQVLTLADAYLRDLMQWQPEFAELFSTAACLPCSALATIARHVQALSLELHWTAPGHGAAADAHLRLLLVELLRLQANVAVRGRATPGRGVELVARFRQRLETHYRAGLSVAAHAVALGVTPAMLRRACATVAGCPPVAIVQERLFREAQRILLYTNMSVGEAAAYLGFDDSAYFTRFFTKQAGLSPRQFRATRRGAHGKA